MKRPDFIVSQGVSNKDVVQLLINLSHNTNYVKLCTTQDGTSCVATQ
jgi:hypothetical protein